MFQASRIMMSCAVQLKGCLDLGDFSTTPEVLAGNWFTWITKMMSFLSETIHGSEF